jgi:hypothetical protein
MFKPEAVSNTLRRVAKNGLNLEIAVEDAHLLGQRVGRLNRA